MRARARTGHASEAEAHRGQPSVDLRTRGQRRDAGPSPLEQEFGVVAQPDETRHHAVAIAGNALAEHVTREGDVPKRRVAPSLPLGVIVETGPTVDDQNSRPPVRRCVIVGKVPGEPCISVSIGQGPRRYRQPSSLSPSPQT